jgi:hypothetical protein
MEADNSFKHENLNKYTEGASVRANSFGGYFMTLNPTQEKIASILLEYEETKKKLALLKAELSRAGEMFSNLAKALIHDPGAIFFTGGVMSKRMGQHPNEYHAEQIDGEKLKKMVSDYITAETELERLKKERTDLGYPVS